MPRYKMGDLVKVTGNSNGHDYTVGTTYRIVHVDTSDNTYKAADLSTGKSMDWLTEADLMPCSSVGWEWLSNHLPAEVTTLLSVFRNREQLELREEIKDHILQSLPDLQERIMRYRADNP